MGAVLYIFWTGFSAEAADAGGQLLGAIIPTQSLLGTVRLRATNTGRANIDSTLSGTVSTG